MNTVIVGHVQPAMKKSASSLLASDYPFILSGQQVTPEVKSLQLKLRPVKSIDPLHVSPQQFVDDVLSAPNQTLPGTLTIQNPDSPMGEFRYVRPRDGTEATARVSSKRPSFPGPAERPRKQPPREIEFD